MIQKMVILVIRNIADTGIPDIQIEPFNKPITLIEQTLAFHEYLLIQDHYLFTVLIIVLSLRNKH